MTRSEDIALVVGPGPVTLSQGPCFQYTAARGSRQLRRLGFRVIVLEDNPATMMDMGDGEGELFMEPPAPEVVEYIVESSGAGSIWHGLGGSRGWILAMKLAAEGWHERLGVATPDLEDRTLWLCGDRSLLRETLEARGIANPAFKAVGSIREGQEAAEGLGFPLVVRPHFSCGGWGAGLAYNLEDYPALLEESMRESLTGEVLVEEALDGWRKYIALALRDKQGRTFIPGIYEQVEPLPKHDEDAVLVFPPQQLGKEELYALREMARQVAESLDFLGLAEIKMAAGPAWEALYVIDVNPRPWRTMPLLEIALGTDLLRSHLELVMGKALSREDIDLEDRQPEGVTVVTSRPLFQADGDGEGYLALGCRSMGRTAFRGGDIVEVTMSATSAILADGGTEPDEEILKALKLLHRLGKRGIAVGASSRAASAARDRSSACISWTADGDLGEGIMLLAGDNAGPGGGYEANANCYLALRAWRDRGKKAALYTPDPGFALLASEEAEAVFLGVLQPECVAEAMSVAGTGILVPNFGGLVAVDVAREVADKGFEVWGMDGVETYSVARRILEQLKHAGLPVIDFNSSKGSEEGAEVLRRGALPMFAAIEGGRGAQTQRPVYTRDDGEALLREYPQEEILWRPLREEAQEIQVEAVGVDDERHILLLWEQVDAAGISTCDGLAVYPPSFITSQQSRRVLDLARRIIDVLGWRGNLSMRIQLNNGDTDLWSVSPGPSANLQFLQRASSVPLAASGIMALGGEEVEAVKPQEDYSAVRAPLIPFGVIAGYDLLPSPQRRSTGAVMGVASDPGMALAKALWSQGLRPQPGGRAFLSVANREKRRAVLLGRELMQAGFVLLATRGTARALTAAGMEVETVNKLREGRPNILDMIRNGQVGLVVNIPRGKHPHSDGFYIRAASARHGIPCITDMEVALALARGLRQADPPAWEVRPLQDYGRPRHEVRGG